MQHDRWQTADPTLAQRGQSLIRWAERRMPALAAYKRQLEQEKPLTGLKIGRPLAGNRRSMSYA